MDIDLARTFLAIVRGGSFMAAAEQLHITQTTVTARVHNLEGLLGCRLFIRTRSGAQLTENGEHFVPYANQLVQTWESSRRNLPLPEGRREMVTIGCDVSLWNPLMTRWLSRLSIDKPDLAVRVDVAEQETLREKLQLGVIFAALVHQPGYWPGIQVEQLLEEKLIMVRAKHNAEPYVFVDWGETFRQQHNAALPHFARAALQISLGPLALQYILENGGSGYFRTRVVEQHLNSGELIRVDGAPEFTYPVFLTYAYPHTHEVMQEVLQSLREVVRDADANGFALKMPG
jgi:DNA-binding transcriptional LysR family regulator